MRHKILSEVTPLSSASTSLLKAAMDTLITESESDIGIAEILGDSGERASRAEALALIGHELFLRDIPREAAISPEPPLPDDIRALEAGGLPR